MTEIIIIPSLPLVNQLAVFVQVNWIQIIQYHFNPYRAIDKIDHEENMVETMGPYDPSKSLVHLI